MNIKLSEFIKDTTYQFKEEKLENTTDEMLEYISDLLIYKKFISDNLILEDKIKIIFCEIFFETVRILENNMKFKFLSEVENKNKIEEKLKEFSFYGNEIYMEKEDNNAKNIFKIKIYSFPDQKNEKEEYYKNIDRDNIEIKKNNIKVTFYEKNITQYNTEHYIEIYYLTNEISKYKNLKKLDKDQIRRLLKVIENIKIGVLFKKRKELINILNESIAYRLVTDLRTRVIGGFIEYLLNNNTKNYDIIKEFFEVEDIIKEVNDTLKELNKTEFYDSLIGNYLDFLYKKLSKGLYFEGYFISKKGYVKNINTCEEFEYEIDLDKNEVNLFDIKNESKYKNEKIINKTNIINNLWKVCLKKNKIKAICNEKLEYEVLNLESINLEEKKILVFQYLKKNNSRKKEIFLLNSKNKIIKKEDIIPYLLFSKQWIFYNKKSNNLFNEYNIKLKLENFIHKSVKRYSCQNLYTLERIYGIKIYIKESRKKFKKDSNELFKEKNNTLFIFFRGKDIFYFFYKNKILEKDKYIYYQPREFYIIEDIGFSIKTLILLKKEKWGKLVSNERKHEVISYVLAIHKLNSVPFDTKKNYRIKPIKVLNIETELTKQMTDREIDEEINKIIYTNSSPSKDDENYLDILELKKGIITLVRKS